MAGRTQKLAGAAAWTGDPGRLPGLLYSGNSFAQAAPVKQLSHAQLAALSQQAQASPRLRMNHNLHDDLSDPIQRLAIAMEPGTYIRPHHHRHTWELLSALRGRFVVLNFDDSGTVTARAVLGAGTSTLNPDAGTGIIETPIACTHAVLSLDPGGVIFEVKHGPYAPFEEKDFAAWSPAADSPASRELMAWFATAAVGQRWPG